MWTISCFFVDSQGQAGINPFHVLFNIYKLGVIILALVIFLESRGDFELAKETNKETIHLMKTIVFFSFHFSEKQAHLEMIKRKCLL